MLFIGVKVTFFVIWNKIFHNVNLMLKREKDINKKCLIVTVQPNKITLLMAMPPT